MSDRSSDLLWLTVFNAARSVSVRVSDPLAAEIADEVCAEYPAHVRVDALLSDEAVDRLWCVMDDATDPDCLTFTMAEARDFLRAVAAALTGKQRHA